MLELLTPEEKSYIIGFLQGDGSHSESTRNRGKVSIELSSRDVDILDKIDNVLSKHVNVLRSKRQRDTNFKKNHISSTLCIHDFGFRKEITKDVPLGYKTDIVKPPSWVVENDRHYIRGYFEADGSLGFKGTGEPFWSLFLKSDELKRYVLSSIEKTVGIVKNINRNKRDNAYNLGLSNENAMLYSKWLYSNASLYLNRKLRISEEMQNWIRVKKVGNRKRTWLNDENNIALSDLSVEEKSKKLGRSIKSIKSRIWRLKRYNKK